MTWRVTERFIDVLGYLSCVNLSQMRSALPSIVVPPNPKMVIVVVH
jgi:hypothetical protein